MPKIACNIIGWLTGIMMCLITLVSVRNYSKIPLGVGPVQYTAGFTLMGLSLICYFADKKHHKMTYLLPLLYALWTSTCIYRGQFEITSAFIFNQYLHGILYVSSPIVIFLFSSPIVILRCFQILNVFIALFAFGSYQWNIRIAAYPFLVVPFFYLYVCFLTKIPKKWRNITLACIGMVFLAHENGSGRIKAVLGFGTLFVFLLPKIIRNISVHIGHWFFYILASVLLYLGLTGQYNIFRGQAGNMNTEETVVPVGFTDEGPREAISDTRTFIYEEMLTSAYMYDHVMIGRTPARGYFSESFAKDATPTEGIDAAERFGSEVANLNAFHWLGLIGLILFTGVFLQGTCLAMYRSKNIYVKCIAMSCAFHWAYGWIENMNCFQLLDLMIYVELAMCYSSAFRNMSDFEFECFFKSLFAKAGTIDTYEKYNIIKRLLEYKASKIPKARTSLTNQYKKGIDTSLRTNQLKQKNDK